MATELTLAGPIRLVAVPALRTGPAGVPWINDNHGHASQPGLVLDAEPQVGEGPVAKLNLEEPVNWLLQETLADARQVLDGDAELECLGSGDDLLCDPVVLVLLEPGLALAQLLQAALRIPRVPLLVRPYGLLTFPAVPLGLFPGELFAFTGGGNLNDSQVNTDAAGRGDRRLRLDFDGDVEVELTVPMDKLRLTHSPAEQVLVAIGTGERYSSSSHQRGDPCLAVVDPVQVSIKVDASGDREIWALGPVDGEGGYDLADCPDRLFGLESEATAKFVVAEPMDISERVYLLRKCHLSGVIGGEIHLPDRLRQLCGLLVVWVKAQLGGDDHGGPPACQTENRVERFAVCGNVVYLPVDMVGLTPGRLCLGPSSSVNYWTAVCFYR
jgi:hypothetical protein